MLDNGHAQLDALRHQLALTIRSVRGEFELALSPHWRDVVTRDVARRFGVPLWVCVALALLIGFGVFVGLRIALAGHSDRLFASTMRCTLKLQPRARRRRRASRSSWNRRSRPARGGGDHTDRSVICAATGVQVRLDVGDRPLCRCSRAWPMR